MLTWCRYFLSLNFFSFFQAGLFFIITWQGAAQSESSFSAHLYHNALYEECIYHFQTLPKEYHTDSTLYYTACSWLAINKLDFAATLFQDIRHDSLLFHAGMGQLVLAALPDSLNRAVSIMEEIPISSNNNIQLYHHLLDAGLGLLSHQPKKCIRILEESIFKTDVPELLTLKESLWARYRDYEQLPHKSPFLAGVLSAAVPGAGKLYAGKKMSAYTAFLQQVILAALVWDAWHIDKRFSPQMIISSSLFTVFYVGNIWGSALSVGISYREKFDTFKQTLLLDLRLPIRYIYP